MAPSRPAQPQLDVATQRIFHVTHIRNFEEILTTGQLVADARPPVDLSSELTRDLRRSAEVRPGSSVADHVPFFLTPSAHAWDDLRRGARGAHWSADARTASPFDMVALVATFGAVGTSAVVTDADAAGSLTRFATDPADAERMLRRLRAEEDALQDAEVLVPEAVPLDTITLVGVANEKVRDRVRTMLGATTFAPKVVVYPPWFQPA